MTSGSALLAESPAGAGASSKQADSSKITHENRAMILTDFNLNHTSL